MVTKIPDPATQETLPLPATSAGTGWSHALRGALLLMLICGGLYPAVTATLGGMLFPHQSTGSLVSINGKVIGSELVGQPFSAPGYFHGRPSAAGYDPFSVSGSNWAPSNPDLRQRAAADAARIAEANNIAANTIPVDLIAASGSGIDPHITPEAARLQIDRVARTRNLPRNQVAGIVNEHVEPPVLSILGQPHVNVLKLNLALDTINQ
ncbi:K+-transporting ATPase ATPase C chain [Methylohalomonas lacus]|uniref:Potassium-transporting ATPase KdpC subunit n=1 Tax=Methylohalomonas lacus TaxID=398773 RepID=A0AAE3HLT9_9GAMM|nr:potassium-transporting ATPase subunit KdpC [Methylohalomonas lacus]MCS3904624.1 K+-transporting ATPase ATPase C chain [Methylohalomonas lacus]